MRSILFQVLVSQGYSPGVSRKLLPWKFEMLKKFPSAGVNFNRGYFVVPKIPNIRIVLIERT
jgi:hypothetical protein